MSWISKIFNPSGSESGTAAFGQTEAAATSRDKHPALIPTDNPIRREQDDALGRARVAKSFARQILSVDAAEGIVVGVLGPWGSGKTSFVNLTRAHLEQLGVAVLDFNPWMFSGAEQLVESFFAELSAQLKLRPALAEIGKGVEFYGELFSGMAWLPLVGPWIERGRTASKLLGQMLERRKEGVGTRRAKLERELASLTHPVAVVVDDIDRLTTAEIRDIFKLVRLTANFPNIVYILSFDRIRVEEALTEGGIAGRDYLEKILQVSIDLPAIPEGALNSQILKGIESAFEGIENPGPFSAGAWQDIFAEIVRPLIRNMRDVRRYVSALHGAVIDLEGQIDLVDMMALEAVRVFLPDVFRELYGSVDGLTTTFDSIPGRSGEAKLKAQIDNLVTTAGNHAAIIEALVYRIFPAAKWHLTNDHRGSGWKSSWLQGRRVAHEHLIRLYLERVVGKGLQAFTEAEHAWSSIADRQGFDTHLRSIAPDQLQDVIASLEAYEDKFKPEHVEPGIIVLLNILPSIPERQRGMVEFDSKIAVTRVVYRLIRSLNNSDAIELAVRRILSEVGSLSAKLDLIRIVGHQEGRGHKLVSEGAAAQFEATWRDEVRQTKAADLARERDLLDLLLSVNRCASSTQPPVPIPDLAFITLAIICSARADAFSQTVGSRDTRRSARLAWDALVEVYGSEEILVERVKQLRASGAREDEELLQLAEKYAGGWRPKQFEFEEE